MKERYGVECGYNIPEVQEKIKSRYGGMGSSSKIILERIKETNLDKYGVPYYCMKEECYGKNGFTISKINLKFAKILDENNIKYEKEFKINQKSYDFHILNSNILIEINPTYTHNSTKSTWFGGYSKNPLDKNYHINKTKLATDNGYRCIHVWDWDDLDKIIKLLKNKTKIYARQCKIKEVPVDETADFLNTYHLQNNCKGQIIRLGLYYKNELVGIMTFGKPRYNINYEYELLRLCFSNYNVVGGSEKLFKYFLDKYSPSSIISYCDNSKFDGNVYTRLNFKLKEFGSPSKHWFNGKKHITDNLLRQRGFDQLFNENYGKGTSNEELMLHHNFVEIYDSGQSSHVWIKE